jgi:hypothetical protein
MKINKLDKKFGINARNLIDLTKEKSTSGALACIETIDLQIRTSRIFGFSETDNQWFQIHHHGSIDNVDLLDRYQKAVKK